MVDGPGDCERRQGHHSGATVVDIAAIAVFCAVDFDPCVVQAEAERGERLHPFHLIVVSKEVDVEDYFSPSAVVHAASKHHLLACLLRVLF